jgi:hypothetical protein
MVRMVARGPTASFCRKQMRRRAERCKGVCLYSGFLGVGGC